MEVGSEEVGTAVAEMEEGAVGMGSVVATTVVPGVAANVAVVKKVAEEMVGAPEVVAAPEEAAAREAAAARRSAGREKRWSLRWR